MESPFRVPLVPTDLSRFQVCLRGEPTIMYLKELNTVHPFKTFAQLPERIAQTYFASNPQRLEGAAEYAQEKGALPDAEKFRSTFEQGQAIFNRTTELSLQMLETMKHAFESWRKNEKPSCRISLLTIDTLKMTDPKHVLELGARVSLLHNMFAVLKENSWIIFPTVPKEVAKTGHTKNPVVIAGAEAGRPYSEFSPTARIAEPFEIQYEGPLNKDGSINLAQGGGTISLAFTKRFGVVVADKLKDIQKHTEAT